MNYGILIHPHEVSDYWADLLLDSGLNLLALHPVGGTRADESLRELLDFVKTERFQSFAEKLAASGVALEYELHTLSWLLPRERFPEHPDWFRMDETGQRTNDFNLCPSSEGAMAELEKRAALLATLLPRYSDRYFFWMDDVAGKSCHCQKCRELMPSDQAMIVYNRILQGIRRVNPRAVQCYLAYIDVIAPPERVRPDEGIFLEYAPICRDSARPLSDPQCEKNRQEERHIDGLLQWFGTAGSQILEYWMDNSRFCGWKLPYVKLPFYPDIIRQDAAFYYSKGFETLTSFGCYLGEDYAKEFGPPPVWEYSTLLKP